MYALGHPHPQPSPRGRGSIAHYRPTTYCIPPTTHHENLHKNRRSSAKPGLFAGPRVAKDDCRIEAYGTVDELNACWAWSAPAANLPTEIDAVLAEIQHRLFDLGAQLATPDPQSRGTNLISPAAGRGARESDRSLRSRPFALEEFHPAGRIDRPPHGCILPARFAAGRSGGSFHSPRSRAVKLSPHALIYLNRLSDLLFVLARAVNRSAGCSDVDGKSGIESGTMVHCLSARPTAPPAFALYSWFHAG